MNHLPGRTQCSYGAGNTSLPTGFPNVLDLPGRQGRGCTGRRRAMVHHPRIPAAGGFLQVQQGTWRRSTAKGKNAHFIDGEKYSRETITIYYADHISGAKYDIMVALTKAFTKRVLWVQNIDDCADNEGTPEPQCLHIFWLRQKTLIIYDQSWKKDL